MYACLASNVDAAAALCEAGADVNFVRESELLLFGGDIITDSVLTGEHRSARATESV